MKTQEPRTIFLKDYRLPPYLIERAELDVHLSPAATRVSSRLHVKPNEAAGKSSRGPLVLDGEKLELISVLVDGRPLAADDFTLGDKALTILKPPAAPFIVEITTQCNPEANRALS